MNRSKGFIAIETIAMVLLVILVVIVAASLATSSNHQTSSASAAELDTSDSINNKLVELQRKKKYEPLNTESLFAEQYEGVPFNQRLFMDAQAQFNDNGGTSVQSSRFMGRITAVSSQPELKITLLGLLESVRDKELEFVYSAETLPKVSVSYGSLSDLQVGQSINIDETNDLSKKYQESIVSVAISPID